VDNRDRLDDFGVDLTFLDTKIGVRTRRVADPSESTSDLCQKAVDAMAESHPKFDPKSLDLLIVCTQNGDYRFPHTSAILQYRIGAPTSCMAFDINLGCSGFVYGLKLVADLVAAGTATDALFLTCDPYTRVVDPQDRNTALLFADAASAAWLTSESIPSILGCDFGTDGSGHEALILPAGGTAAGIKAEGNHFKMDGREVYQFVVQSIPASVGRCLDSAELSAEDVDFYVFHQGSGHILTSLQRQLRIPDEKLVRELEDLGNTVSSTIPIALARLADRVDLRGKNILISGFGVGLSWGTAVVRL
jgi:3-oxoacyl-[acyl-carrier-protein] synthase-3